MDSREEDPAAGQELWTLHHDGDRLTATISNERVTDGDFEGDSAIVLTVRRQDGETVFRQDFRSSADAEEYAQRLRFAAERNGYRADRRRGWRRKA
jgi:hypothetical protein